MPEPIRVMIVDDVQETRENLRKLLSFEPNVQVVGEAATGRQALQEAPRLDPDVIIMDIHLPDMSGLEVTEQLKKALPATQIVVLTVQGDIEYIRRAMMAGARDFLTKPPAIDELLDAVRRAGELAREERQKLVVAQEAGPVAGVTPEGGPGAHIITVLGAKGGVGKTALTANLAAALQTPGTTVIVVDAKWAFGDLVVVFNMHPNHVWTEIENPQELDLLAQMLTTHEETGIRVLAAPVRLETQAGSPEQFANILQALRSLADYIVVDTGHPLDELTQQALNLSAMALLVFEQDLISVRNVRLLLDLFAQEFPQERRMLVMNRVAKRKGVSPERLESFLKEKVWAIPEDPHMPVSINQGKLLVRMRRNAPAAQGILRVARHVRERLVEMEEA